MLAYFRGPKACAEGLGNRVGNSLGLFAGLAVPAWSEGDRIAWQLPRVGNLPPRALRSGEARRLRTSPAMLEGGIAVLVHGWIDNCAELATELGCAPTDQALIYAHAVRRWGDRADERILGFYCAVYDDPAVPHLRLARSAVMAPPIYYMADADGVWRFGGPLGERRCSGRANATGWTRFILWPARILRGWDCRFPGRGARWWIGCLGLTAG